MASDPKVEELIEILRAIVPQHSGACVSCWPDGSLVVTEESCRCSDPVKAAHRAIGRLPKVLRTGADDAKR